MDDATPAAAEDAALMTGRVGPYEIRRRLGAGAMGVVYEAWDPRLRRPVALKMLPADGNDEERVARLVREAQALAQIRHPNVVAVHDVGTHEGRVYIVMELVSGETLDRWVVRVRPSVDQLLRVLSAVGEGLAVAHERGLVHRDVKPENVLVDREGNPRVVDFGLARIAEEGLLNTLAQAIPNDAADARLTQTGTILGTPVFMSPEQLGGRPVDARSDQYAFGVTAYALLYDDLPFAHDSIGALIEAVTQNEVRTPPAVGEPRAVRQAILRTLAPDPERRFASMRDLVAVLSPTSPPLAEAMGAQAPPRPAPERQRRAKASGFPVALVVGVAIIALFSVGALGVGVGLYAARRTDVASTGESTGIAVPDVVPVAATDDGAFMVPVVPAEPVVPVVPTQPDAPTQPDTPREPHTPREPDTSREPDTPREPREPAEPLEGDSPPPRSAPLRRVVVASHQNLWHNGDAMAAAGRRLRGRVSRCFDPDWHYDGRGASLLGISLLVEPDGRVSDVAVEPEPRLSTRTLSCIDHVFTAGIGRLPPTNSSSPRTVNFAIHLEPDA